MSGNVVQWETAQDGLDNLTMAEAPMPSPGEDQVLVEISCLSLNYRDTEGRFEFLIFEEAMNLTRA